MLGLDTIDIVLGISLLELIVSLIILIDFGPETVRKVERGYRSAREWME
jgi:hypothetical protein